MLQALHVENAKHLRGRPSWRHITRPRAPGTNTALKPLTVGFYVSWDPDSRASLAQHVGSLDVVAPQWFALKDTAGDLDITDDPQAVALISSAPHPPAVLPVVHNAHEDAFDTALGDGLLHNPAGPGPADRHPGRPGAEEGLLRLHLRHREHLARRRSPSIRPSSPRRGRR